jgi:adenosylmethionine-8-amino-7-oxononanoate aminotransferase
VGFIGAVELFRDVTTRQPFPLTDQMGIRVCRELRRRGVLTRPIGNTIVIMPPYCITAGQLATVGTALRESIRGVGGAK